MRKTRPRSPVWTEEGEKEEDEKKARRREGSHGRGGKGRCSGGRGGEEVRRGVEGAGGGNVTFSLSVFILRPFKK